MSTLSVSMLSVVSFSCAALDDSVDGIAGLLWLLMVLSTTGFVSFYVTPASCLYDAFAGLLFCCLVSAGLRRYCCSYWRLPIFPFVSASANCGRWTACYY
jgi:hypothetical protein